jgi:hypothetical protein
MPTRGKRLLIFICYAHKDQNAIREIKDFMENEIRRAGAELWWDEDIPSAELFDKVIKQKLEEADIVLPFVSQDFFNSRYITDIEIRTAIARRKKEGLPIAPIILSPCAWNRRRWLRATQCLHPTEKTISEYSKPERQRLLLKITTNLVEIIKTRRNSLLQFTQSVKLPPDTRGAVKPSIFPHEGEPIGDKHEHLDLADPQLRNFLNQSGPSLVGIDTSALLWAAPSVANEDDWGWRGEEVQMLPITNQLLDGLLPLELQKISLDWRTKQLREKPLWKDSIRYCVNKIEVEPNNGIRIFVQPIKTGTWYPISFKLYETRNQSNAAVRRNFYHHLEEKELPLIPNGFVMSILLLTGDNKLLLYQRGENVAFYQKYWSASFEEQFNGPWTDHFGRKEEVYQDAWDVDSTIQDALVRAVKEEAHLFPHQIPSPQDTRVMGIGFDYNDFWVHLFAIVKLRENLTHEVLSTQILDSHEARAHAFCPFKEDFLKKSIIFGDAIPKSALIIPWVTDEEASERKRIEWVENWKWHPTSRMRMALGLGREFGGGQKFREFLRR